MANKFHGYELLLLKRLQTDPEFRCEWKTKLQHKLSDEDLDLGLVLKEIPHRLWFLAVTIDRNKDRLVDFVTEQIDRTKSRCFWPVGETPLSHYLNKYQFTELHLDGIFKFGEDNSLPTEIFKCRSVTYLSMKYNYLDRIPPDIGQMKKLEYLSLTNNKLQIKSLPFTLSFCTKLKTLLLDNNLLDALPGFLLKMPSLESVHRHGNHNYFKSTFMWYHTDVYERILGVPGIVNFQPIKDPERLQFWAAKAVIGSKIDYYADPSVAKVLEGYISEIYPRFNICGYCNTAKLRTQAGYKVITFKNPYLGNTCVPFQYWACSMSCAQAIEIPARLEQITAAQDLDRQYDAYIKECQKQWKQYTHKRKPVVLPTSPPSDTMTTHNVHTQHSAEYVKLKRTRRQEPLCKCAIM